MAKFKVVEIIPGKVYQRGEFFDSGTTEWKQERLVELKICCVVNLLPKKDHELAAVMKSCYFHLPMPDGARFDEATLMEGAVKVAELLEIKGLGVLVHCRAGRNRSSLFSALLAIRFLNLTGKQSVEFMLKQRPNALANEAFVKFLKRVDRYSDALGCYLLKE